eukprot:TRINITY_DN5281_c0_g1_i1.p1 TRINITY_DN5281_c0_g1~~TRINITY_DN5281_c0_g1_i1.p1  ORF type:complete len:220 (-),score=30.80 TRINITY_DN5281_c0_g1_i1:662-1321(-)
MTSSVISNVTCTNKLSQPAILGKKISGKQVPLKLKKSVNRMKKRSNVEIECNELNKWANTDGPDENAGLPDNSFARYTNLVVLKCLTARAVQKIILELQTSDTQSAQWLNKYCGEHPPLEGDNFLLELMGMQNIHSPGDQYGHEFVVRPMELANRIIAYRAELSKLIASEIQGIAVEKNIGVMRSHLEKHSYVSGSWDTEDKRVKAKLEDKSKANEITH